VHLDELVPTGTFVGTSLILRSGGRLLYGCRAPQFERTRQVVELTGIGGRLEPADASLIAGVRREAQEEIGCDVQVVPSHETVVVRGPGRTERVTLSGAERPAAVVFRRFRTPPHAPWHADHRGEAHLVVFAAELCGDPRPTGELPALAWLSPAHVVATAHHDLPLRQLLDGGASLIESAADPVPRTAWVRLTDSQEALAIALQADAVPFFAALAAAA
jgi:8-oxo-dGTP pyrophosphatase MutT (NUDIX family)